MISFLGIDVHLVRLGHILESGRSWERYLLAISASVKDEFTYTWRENIDDELRSWRAYAKHVLIMSRPARDLSEDQEEFILDAISSSWMSSRDEHVCGPWCRLGCNKSKVKANYSAVQWHRT